MKKSLFYIGTGVYPIVVGGMEVFNYYLLNSLSKILQIGYVAEHKYDFNGLDFIKYRNFHPIRLFYPLQLFWILLKVRRRYDKIVFSYSEAHWIIWYSSYIICRLFSIPYVLVIHHGKNSPEKKAFVYEKLFAGAERVIAVSYAIKQNYDDKFHINSEVIYPLVPFPKSAYTKAELRDKYNIPTDATVICMVGTIKPMKNPDTLLEAVAKMTCEERAKYKPHVVYAGRGEMVAALKQKASDLMIQDHVTFLGLIAKDKICEIMELSDVYVIASDFEGTSVSLLEAMFNKKTIIASKVQGIVETISDKECLFFPVRDSDALYRALLAVLCDKELRLSLSHAAYNRFEQDYNYSDILEQFAEILSA